MLPKSGAWAHWGRSVHGKRRKKGSSETTQENGVLDAFRFRTEGQLSLDDLGSNRISQPPEDVLDVGHEITSRDSVTTTASSASTSTKSHVKSRKRAQPSLEEQNFQSAASLYTGPKLPRSTRSRNRKKGKALHSKPTPSLGSESDSNPPELLANGAGDNHEPDTVLSADAEGLKDLIKGEVTEAHLQQILSMRIDRGTIQVTEADIGGLASVKRLIRNKIIAPIKRPDLHQGLYRASRGILFFGPPGTGKTTLAKWIASESGATFFNVTASSLISKYHGETETLVATLFVVAERLAPSVIFLDEIDGLAGKRREKEEDATLRMKNQLLQAMDGMNSSQRTVVIIGATNRPDSLDEAALRRLSKRVFIPLPDLEARIYQIRHILRRHAASIGNVPTSVDEISEDALREVAEELEGYNGSDLQAICGKAAEFIYEEVVDAYGGDISAIPGPQAFRLPNAQELRRAKCFVARSSDSSLSGVDFDEWSKRLGCQ